MSDGGDVDADERLFAHSRQAYRETVPAPVRRVVWELRSFPRRLLQALLYKDEPAYRPMASKLVDEYTDLDLGSPEEQDWVERFAATRYGGRGAVVELGCWLGATTHALAHGVAANPSLDPLRATIHVYDAFRFDDMAHLAPKSAIAESYVEGGSFRAVFDRRLARFASMLDVHEGDVKEPGQWPSAEPIEFLFNDLSKSWDTYRRVREDFYGSLVPGLSVLVEQDFAHACTPWVHLWHARARPYFEVEGQLPSAGSVAFRLVKALPDELITDRSGHAEHSKAEIEEAFHWAEQQVGVLWRPNVRGARIMLEVLHGDLTEAVRLLAEADQDGLIRGEIVSLVIPELVRRLEASPDHDLAAPA